MKYLVLPALLIFFIYSEKIFSRIVYEQCNWRNKQYTQNLLRDTERFQQLLEESESYKESEAGYCGGYCQLQKMLINIGLDDWTPLGETVAEATPEGIPPICFYASMTRDNRPSIRYYFYCQSPNENRSKVRRMPFVCKNAEWEIGCELIQAPDKRINNWESPRRPCINEDYVDKTARAFDTVADCFDFSDAEKIQLFSLFNHESSFHVNARSGGDARCYGQLTYIRFADINKYIYFRDNLKAGRQSWAPYSQVYKDAVQKCPDLEKKVIPQTLLSETNHTEQTLRNINRNSNFTCGVTHDIHACLFYSMYSVKMDMVMFDQEYNEHMENSRRNDTTEKLRSDFGLPIPFDSVLVITGKVQDKKTGQVIEKDWIVTSHSEIQQLFQERYDYNVRDLNIKKVKLFAHEDLKYYFTRVAHNGGNSQIRTYFERFVRRMKQALRTENSCEQQSQSLDCKNRKAILAAQTLTADDLNQQFKRYVRPRTIQNKREVMAFVDNINDNIAFLNDYSEDTKDPRPLQTRMRRLFSNSGREVSSMETDKIINDVKKQCSSIIHQRR